MELIEDKYLLNYNGNMLSFGNSLLQGMSWIHPPFKPFTASGGSDWSKSTTAHTAGSLTGVAATASMTVNYVKGFIPSDWTAEHPSTAGHTTFPWFTPKSASALSLHVTGGWDFGYFKYGSFTERATVYGSLHPSVIAQYHQYGYDSFGKYYSEYYTGRYGNRVFNTYFHGETQNEGVINFTADITPGFLETIDDNIFVSASVYPRGITTEAISEQLNNLGVWMSWTATGLAPDFS